MRYWTVDELLALANGFPRRSLAAGEQLIVSGEAVHALYVLIDGGMRIEKDGIAIAAVSEPGACLGEMSLLLGTSATANVFATEPTTLAVIGNAQAMLADDSGLSLSLARLLASRLQVMTTYLADLRLQYADHEGGLGMIDTVLGALMRSPGARSELGSERDPYPED